MKVLEKNNLMEIKAGAGFVDGVCAGLAAGSLIYGIGAATNFWNPVGWVSAAFIVADGACLAYGISQM